MAVVRHVSVLWSHKLHIFSFSFLQTLPSIRQITPCTCRNTQACGQSWGLPLLPSASPPPAMRKAMVRCSHLIYCNPGLYSWERVNKVHLLSFHLKEKSIRPQKIKTHHESARHFKSMCFCNSEMECSSPYWHFSSLVQDLSLRFFFMVGVQETCVHVTPDSVILQRKFFLSPSSVHSRCFGAVVHLKSLTMNLNTL